MMVRMITRGRSIPALLVLAALLTGAVGPCLCAPSAGSAEASHDCCAPAAGLRAASADCCTTCVVPLRAPEATVTETGAALTVPVLAALPRRIATAVPANVAYRDRLLDTSTSPPPTILRV
jgi:hypothetical protein